MCQIPGGFPVPTGGSLQPVGDEIAQRTGIAAAGNATIEAAFGLKLQVFHGERLSRLVPVAQTLRSGPMCRFYSGFRGPRFSLEQMAGILPQIGPEQVAHIMNRQCIGGTGDDATGAAHTVLEAGDLSCRLALSPHRYAHVAGLLTALAVSV